MSDTEYKQGIEQGDLGDAKDVTDPVRETRRMYTDVFRIRKTAADAMAADATGETFGFTFPLLTGFTAATRYGRVMRIDVTTDADVPVDAADGAVITVSKRDAAGANKTTLGTYSTLAAAQGGLAEFVRKTFALTNANLEVLMGGSVTFEIAKAGAGQIVPISEIQVHVLRG